MRDHGFLIAIVAAVALAALFLATRRRAPSLARVDHAEAPPASAATGAVQPRAPGVGNVDRARDLQRRYWSPSPEEKGRLLARAEAALSWTEKLRLLHLTCLDELSSGASRRMLDADDLDPQDMPAGPNRDRVVRLVTDLRSASSPFRPRRVAVWTGKAGESEHREPNAQGLFENASLTHLGALEVVRLDAELQPTELTFVPLDDLRGVVLASPVLFRLAKLFFEDGRPDEVVLLPMIYGISWSSSNPALHDGTLTNFVAHIDLPGVGVGPAIGVGHQDFVVAGDGQRLMGLGAIGEIMVALSTDDPRFEQKCRARGLDPAAVRADLAKKR